MPFENAQTEDLVIASLLGDLRAFDLLVLRYRSAVMTVAKQYAESRELAEDIVQEVFVTAYNALPQLSDPGSFPSWLYSIARRRALRISQKSRRIQPLEASLLDSMISKFASETQLEPEEECLERLEQDWIWERVRSLKEEYRLPILLHYQSEMSVREIAEFLAISETTVKWRLYQGRQKLKNLLAELECEEDDEAEARAKS